ncbi:hypothetical protein N8J89_16255 [Crossiella sp. CA-258035]|uniref:hypothetical protein n=1 Tax=Crossiella sp. CA-258035 TaxID=2981138 RepID=UPI0024BC1B11|nr:hypothetical protein [Crossiella sp. CA-258035]WHT22551.1 hypothetical protein N8J89_16255 [Crossiella sp. CA-258035]
MIQFVTITGPRAVADLPVAELGRRFEAYLGPFAVPGSHFYLGGATGVDTLALDWLAQHTGAALTVAVPCRLVDQPTDARQVVARWQSRDRLTEVVELRAATLGTDAYHARNRWMVDRSSLVVGFPRRNHPASGTWYTLNYAAERGTPHLVVPV